MKGWFDAFRYDGGPTLYSFNNRTAVTGDVTLITFLTIFCTLYVAFLIIFPGIRKEVGATFYTITKIPP
jgi:dual oxidase maturation factor 1